MARKFTSYLIYIGCAELWKEQYIPGFEFCSIGLFGDTEPEFYYS